MDPDEYKEILASGRTEEEVQKQLLNWVDAEAHNDPRLLSLFHVPNGGKMPMGAAGKLKGMGMRKGVPDLFLPEPVNPFYGLWLEMKKADGYLRPNQRWWLNRLRERGYCTAVAYGLDEGISVLEQYLSGEYEQEEFSGKEDPPPHAE